MQNPYQPPTAEQAGVMVTIPGYVACPKCGSTAIERPGYTWWGGVLGPKVIPVAKCTSCKHSYQGKTGGSLTPAIVVYSIVILVVFGGVMAAVSSGL